MIEPVVQFLERPQSAIIAMQLAASKDRREKDRLIREYAKALSEDVRKCSDYIINKRTKKGA